MIVPSTLKPNEEGDFLLRVFYTKEVTSTNIYKPEKTVKPNYEASKTSSEISQKFQEVFNKLAGNDGEIDAYQLVQILESVSKQKFEGKEVNIEVARTLIAAFDRDESGKIGVEEFQELLNKLREWKGVFAKYDRDKSNSMDVYELREALDSLGIKVSNDILLKTIAKYSSKQGKINFPEFLLCVNKLEQAFETFMRMRTDQSYELISCDLETWIRHML
ncbi:EF-hand domain-containing protein [Dapis sp. BLCC M126]|uniref:EF-hand domain-containing protein n=1 Tax=Dapis sp. BLCC M126 TaxID=3400189 RepID=UPI003CEC15C4